MIVYFDTSALVKRYDTREAGASQVIAFFATNPTIFTSLFTPLEVISAFRIKERSAAFTPNDVYHMTTALDFHTNSDYDLVPPQLNTYQLARELVLRYKLRTYDALHIATALGIAQAANISPAMVNFWTSDQDQAVAAQAEGLTVVSV
jgi:uncharacterized protein